MYAVSKDLQRLFLFILIQLVLIFVYHGIFTLDGVSLESSDFIVEKKFVRIIHQSWKSKDLPPAFQAWSQSWRTCFPDWEYKLWTDAENRELIRQAYPWFLQIYDSFPKMIHRADMMRAFYMHHYGGIYTDLDTECLRPFEHLLRNSSIVLGAMSGRFGYMIKEGYTQNSFMYSRHGHSFWMLFVHDVMNIVNKVNKKSSDYRTWPGDFTGPTSLMKSIDHYRNLTHNDITVYPPYMFNPYSWIGRNPYPGCNTLGRMNWKNYQTCRSHFTNKSYVVQYHSQSWNMGKSRVGETLKKDKNNK